MSLSSLTGRLSSFRTSIQSCPSKKVLVRQRYTAQQADLCLNRCFLKGDSSIALMRSESNSWEYFCQQNSTKLKMRF